MSNSPKFLLDENIRIGVKKFLENKRFIVEYVPKGSTDSEVLSLAKEKKSVLVTHDTDFANSFLYPPNEFSGIVVIRIYPPTLDKILPSLERFLSEVKEFKGRLFLLEVEGFKVVGH